VWFCIDVASPGLDSLFASASPRYSNERVGAGVAACRGHKRARLLVAMPLPQALRLCRCVAGQWVVSTASENKS
jgi:hypothetical protein